MRRLIKRVDRRKLAGRTIISFFFAMVAVFSFRHILTSKGVIGLVYEWGLPPFIGQFAEKIGWNFSAWKPFPDLGSPGSPTVGLYFDFFMNALYSIGLDGEFISKFLSVLLMTIAGLSTFYLARKIKLGVPASIVSGLLYILSPIMFDRFVVGHLVIILDYSLLPLVIAFFIGSLERKAGFRYFAASGLLLTLATSHMTSFFLVFTALFLYSIVHGLFEKTWRDFLMALRNIAFFFVVPVLIHIFWIAPLLKELFLGNLNDSVGGAVGNLPIQLLIAESPFGRLFYTIRLMGYHGAFFNTVGLNGDHWTVASYLIPILAFVGFLLRPRKKLAIFSVLLAITGILLASAQMGPLGSLYYWLFEHLPFLWIFRDPSYWIHLTTLGYALLLGSLAAILAELVQKISFNLILNLRRQSLSLTGGVMALPIIIVILIYGYPYLTGNFGSFMQTCSFYTEDHQALWQWVRDNPEDFRPLQLQGPYPNLYEGYDRWGYDMMTVYNGKPGIYYAKVYDPQIIRFMYKTFYDNQTENIAQLLGLMNVKYLIFDPSKIPAATVVNSASQAFPEELFTNDKLTYSLSRQKDISLYGKIGQIEIYENEKFLPHVSPVSQIALYAGNFDGLIDISYLENLELKDLGLVFAGQLSPEQIAGLLQMPDTKLVIQDGHFTDLLIASSLDKQEFPLFEFVPSGAANEGWAALWNLWYNWQYQANPERSIYTFIPSLFTVPYSVGKEGQYYLFIKPYFGPQRTSLKISSDGTPLGEVATGATGDVGFQWRQLGPFTLQPGAHYFQIESGQGENALGGLTLIPRESLDKSQQKIDELIQGKDSISISKFNTPSISETIWKRDGQEIYLSANQTAEPRFPKGEPYDIGVQDDTFVVKMPFHYGPSIEEGFVFMVDTSNDPIDLDKIPYFGLDQKMDNPRIANQIFRFFIDTDGDGKSDTVFRSYDDRAIFDSLNNAGATEFREIEFNVLGAVQKLYPNKQMYRVLGIELDFRKIGTTDCSGKFSGDYSFSVKNMQFRASPSLISEGISYASQGTAVSTTYQHQIPIYQHITVPKDGQYQLYLRAASGKGVSNVSVNISDSQFNVTLNPLSQGFTWYNLGQAYLIGGSYDFSVTSDGSDIIYLDLMVLAEPNLPATTKDAATLITSKLSYSKYKIQAQALQPFYLFFSERYDRDWKLKLDDGTELSGIPGYSFGNLYYVNQTGEFNMTLEYAKQSEHTFFLWLSFSFLILILSAVLISFFYKPSWWQKLKRISKIRR